MYVCILSTFVYDTCSFHEIFFTCFMVRWNSSSE